MENESNIRKIAFSVVGVIVIGAAIFTLWYRSQESQKETQPQTQESVNAQVIEPQADDPYGKLTIPASE